LRSYSLCNILFDERIGLFLMNMLGLLSSIRIAHIAHYWKWFLFTIYKSSVSPGFAKQIMPILLIFERTAAGGLRCIVLARTTHKTPLPSVPLLLLIYSLQPKSVDRAIAY
jgi:hypothetical protein